VRKKLLIGVVALILVALVVPLVTACPAAPTAPVKDKIVVGMARSLSGPLTAIEVSGFGPIYKAWVPEVNADGGIFVTEYGKKLPVELKIYDDKSDTGTAVMLTEKLMTEDKVDFIWSSNSTAMLFAQAPVANKYGYILPTFEGGATTMKDMLYSLPYVFVNLSFSDWYEVPVWADMLASKGREVGICDLYCRPPWH
jgi:branched-chain amino acid transport system substrate-binding protein